MTHFKAGYLRRNGVPSSDQATITWFFRRYGDLLTITAIVEDPNYLAQPYILNRTWQLNPNAVLSPIPAPCEPTIESPGIAEGEVPHYLPGANPFVAEVSQRYGIPVSATLGGPETMYPEFWRVIRDTYVRPDRCTRFCCGWEGGGAATTLPACTLREAPLTRAPAR
jgi:hypothetical protein